MTWIFWAPLGAAALHIVEEFLWPGGFLGWYRRYKPEIAASVTPRSLFILNALLLILCYDVGAMRAGPVGPPLWFGVMALLFANAGWHLVAAVKTRGYSPGLITGLLLYVPLSLWGAVQLLQARAVTLPVAAGAAAVGGSYQVWMDLLHRRRARAGGRPPSSRGPDTY